MQRNSVAPLGKLRTGDRFVFPGKPNEVWEVTGFKNKGKIVTYNRIQNGKKLFLYDHEKRSITAVKFLRHTLPVPGDECGIEDLKAGDVFTLTTNIVLEYRVREQFKDQACPAGECKAVKLDGSKDFLFIKHGTPVVFIHKEEEVLP